MHQGTRTDNLICYHMKQIDVSFESLFPLIDNEFRQNIVKVVCGSGFLLRAGNRLFFPAVQVNVTGCFTEIFTEIIQRMFVFLNRGEIPLCLWEDIAFPFKPMLWRFPADVTALKIHNLLKQSSLFFSNSPFETTSAMFPFYSSRSQGKPPITHWETLTKWRPHSERGRG